MPGAVLREESGQTNVDLRLSSPSPRGGGVPGPYVGELGNLWELCNKFEPFWWGKCGGLDLRWSNSREEIGSKFHSIDEKIAIDENKKVCVKTHRLFFGP